MADADFGYVGGAPGQVESVRRQNCREIQYPRTEAVDRLKDLIREHCKWIEPARREAALEPAS